MQSLEELTFALDVIEAERPVDAALLAAPPGYVPGANPNDLSQAEMEQRKQAALKSAEARRKTGVAEMLRIRNEAVANVAVRKAQADFFMQVAGENRKQEIRSELADPHLTQAERDALTAELADVYATEQLYNAERAQQNVKRQQTLRYWTREMQTASQNYDSQAFINARAQVDALKKEMDEEEIAGALLKEHQSARKDYLADEERQRKQVEKEEREHQRKLKAFYQELERQRKKREREAESAKKKAERERERAAKKAEKEAKKKKGKRTDLQQRIYEMSNDERQDYYRRNPHGPSR